MSPTGVHTPAWSLALRSAPSGVSSLIFRRLLLDVHSYTGMFMTPCCQVGWSQPANQTVPTPLTLRPRMNDKEEACESRLCSVA